MANSGFKNRCYTVTVQGGHLTSLYPSGDILDAYAIENIRVHKVTGARARADNHLENASTRGAELASPPLLEESSSKFDETFQSFSPAGEIKSTEWTASPAIEGEESIAGPARWFSWLYCLAKIFDLGGVDYACISMEDSKGGGQHLQGFVVFNEVVEIGQLQDDLETVLYPTDLLPGHWLKARSLSGARDYCAKAGIHVGKPGVFGMIEMGDWIDPAWNQSLRQRLMYDFAYKINQGFRPEELADYNAAGVLLIGENNLEKLCRLRQKPCRDTANAVRPYYYIGRTQMTSDCLIRGSEFNNWMENEAQTEEE